MIDSWEDEMDRRTRRLFIATVVWTSLAAGVLLVSINALPLTLAWKQILLAATFGLSIPLALRASRRTFRNEGPQGPKNHRARLDPWKSFAGRPVQHPIREQILQCLIAGPERTPLELTRCLRLPYAVVKHHLRVLGQMGLVVHRRNLNRHFYRASNLQTPDPVLARKAFAADIVLDLRIQPHTGVYKLAHSMQTRPGIVRQYLRDLEKAGIVTKTRRSGLPVYEVQPSLADGLLGSVTRGLLQPRPGLANPTTGEARRTPLDSSSGLDLDPWRLK